MFLLSMYPSTPFSHIYFSPFLIYIFLSATPKNLNPRLGRLHEQQCLESHMGGSPLPLDEMVTFDFYFFAVTIIWLVLVVGRNWLQQTKNICIHENKQNKRYGDAACYVMYEVERKRLYLTPVTLLSIAKPRWFSFFLFVLYALCRLHK